MSNIKKRRKWNKHGVSEIIGNILILGITVTLFSSIMWFVTAMPTPQEHAYADMTSDLHTDYNHTTRVGWAEISVTHKGGQELKNDAIGIYIWINDTTLLRYKITNSQTVPSIGTSWTAGEIWKIDISSSFPVGKDPSKARISLMITDTVKNSEVYTVTLNGGESGTNPSPPIIGARGTTPSPTYTGDTFWFYATVTDSNNNLRTNSVFIDASILNPSWASLRMWDNNSDGVFTKQCPKAADLSWNGKIVIVNATDATGLSTTGRITLSILYKGEGGITNPQYGPYYNYSSYFVNGTYPPDATGGESGGAGEIGTTFYYIRRMSDMTITNSFSPGEKVLIEVYSDGLRNLGIENAFFLYQPITGDPMSPQSQASDAFAYGGIFGTFHRYIINFSAPTDPYIYPLQLKLKDTSGTAINIMDTISSAGGSYPKLETYKYVALGNKLVKTSNFNHTDTMYVRIITKDPDLSASTVYVSDIEVSDYSGRYIVKKVPATFASPTPAYNAPISSIFKTTDTSSTLMGEGFKTGTYTYYMVLKDAYQGWWLPKKNAYTLKISMVTDTGTGPGTAEVYHGLSLQFNVSAPLSTTDLLASTGSGSFTWSSSGATWDNNQIAWYSGGDQWDETVIDNNPSKGPIGLALGDISGYGRNDAVVGSQDPSYANLFWYENQKADGSSWSSARPIAMPFDALTTNTNPGNSDKGNANEDVTVWSTRSGSFETSYGADSYISPNEISGAIAVADLDRDGDGEVIASFVHPVVISDATSPGGANSGNSWGAYFNRGIYVFWNDGSWTRTTLFSTTDWIANDAANKDSNPAAMGIATGDFDQDGYPDIVAVYENGATNVWINQWGKIATGDVRAHETGAFSTSASLRSVPQITPAAENSYPWDHIQYIPKVRVADMNLDGFPDIIRTTTVGRHVVVIQTVPGLPDQQSFTATFEYSPRSNTAGVTGSKANLNAVDGAYETLREVYKNYSATVTAMPTLTDARDNTTLSSPANIPANLNANDSANYDVANNRMMWMTYWNLDSTYNGKIASYAKLKVSYTVDPAFVTKGYLQYSLDGIIFKNTTIMPTTGDSAIYKTFIFPTSPGLDFSKIQNMDIRFYNSGGGATVHFSMMNIDVFFVETRQLEWVWQIPDANRAFHNLTFYGHKVPGSTEGFRLAYSVDNTTWFNLTDITWTVDRYFYYDLPYTPSSYYWVKVTDLDRSTADIFNDTLMVDMLTIRHYAQTVSWDAAHTFKNAWQAPDYITAIAIGDMGKMGGDSKPDGWLDIVVTTARVGSGYDTQSLYIMAATALNTPAFDTRPVYTTQMSIMCSNSALYDIKAVEIGDFNGDGFNDIVVVVGAPFGVDPGTGPTMWTYINQNMFSSTAWQYTESYVNTLASKGESAINVQTGNINLSIFLPFLGVLGVIAVNTLVERKKKQ
jgi:hypothetical protein